MPLNLTFEIKQKANTGGALLSQAPRAIATTQIQSWDILVTGTGDLVPSQISEQNVLAADVFPIVNQSVFSIDWNPPAAPSIIPWLICLSKRAERDTQTRELFRVSADFGTGNRFHLDESDLELIDAPADITGLPFIKETVWGEEDRVIYKEAEPPASTRQLRLPTGSYYSESFRRKFPKRIIRQSQFESITLADVDSVIESRLFTLQDISFGGSPGGTPDDPASPPRWMITKIDYQPVIVPNAAGGTYSAMLMSYVFERNANDGGWDDRRALVDKFFLTSPDDLTTKDYFTDRRDGRTVIDGLLNADGTAKTGAPPGGQTGDPSFLDYHVQPTGQWSFIQT